MIIRSPKHLSRVRGLDCLICRRKAPNDPHHLMMIGNHSMGRKEDDCWVVPLCRVHHDQVTNIGNETKFWELYGYSYELITRIAEKLWRQTNKLEL